MATLHDRINSLASDFAHQLLAALRGASLDEIISETSAGHIGRRGPGRPAGSRNKTQVRRGPGRPPKAHTTSPKTGGKRVRRSAEDIAQTVEKIATVLKGHKNGLRSEQLQKLLHIAKKDITKPITVALKSKTLRKTGQKRATTYFSGAPQAPSKAKAKKTTPRAKKARKAKKQVVARARQASVKKVAKTKPSARGANGAVHAVPTAAAPAS